MQKNLAKTILQKMREAETEQVRDGLPPEVFAKFLVEDDPYRKSISGETYGQRTN